LLEKSLIGGVDDTDARVRPRIAMLETIREYTAERLNAIPEYAEEAREAHAREFARLAAEASGAAGGSEDAADERLSADLENLRIAWRFWTARKDVERLADLRDALWNVYEARGWYSACVDMIRDQLAALETRPASQERWREEVALRTSLARMLTLQLGYAAEAEDAYEQALAMFDGQREVPQLFPVLRSLASFHGFRGEFEKGIEYGTEIIRLADEQHDANMRVDGLFLVGSYTAFTGKLAEGLEIVNEAIRAFETGGYRPRRLRLGVDTRISSLTTSGFFMWILGFPDQAVVRADRAVAIARELDHPYSLAYGLFHSGFVHYWRREPEIVRERAKAVAQVVDETDLPIWRALGTCLLGAAEVELGEVAAGLAKIAEGLALYRGLRTPPVFWPFVRYLQATAYVHAGERSAGMQMIEEALAIGGSDEMTSSLFHIVRGDLALLEPHPDPVSAVASYEQAIEGARRFDARLPMLRAAARLCRAVGPDDKGMARETLRRAYESFTEGFTTRDVAEAAELLR
jgi:tetratricopeptide (TPR) repeat protein